MVPIRVDRQEHTSLSRGQYLGLECLLLDRVAHRDGDLIALGAFKYADEYVE